METGFWGWFAGFWEGEGSILVFEYPGTRSAFQTELCACQKVKTPLEYIRRETGVGKVVFNRTQWGGVWRWRTRRRPDIIRVGRKLLPYLRFRQEEMKSVLATIQKREDNRHWNDWTDDELSFLKEKSDKIPPKEIVKSLPRHTYHAIFTKRRKLGLVGGAWVGRNQFS